MRATDGHVIIRADGAFTEAGGLLVQHQRCVGTTGEVLDVGAPVVGPRQMSFMPASPLEVGRRVVYNYLQTPRIGDLVFCSQDYVYAMLDPLESVNGYVLIRDEDVRYQAGGLREDVREFSVGVVVSSSMNLFYRDHGRSDGEFAAGDRVAFNRRDGFRILPDEFADGGRSLFAVPGWRILWKG